MYKFKLLFAILIVASIFSCSKDDSIKKDAHNESKASSNLSKYFDSNDIKIIDGIMHFKDNTVFEKAIEDLYSLDQDAFDNLSKENGFLSFSDYFESIEDKNLILRENPHLIKKNGDEFYPKLQLDRISSKEGVYVIGENVIFNNSDYTIIKNKYSPVDHQNFISAIKNYQKNKSKSEKLIYHDWQKDNDLRNCNLSFFSGVRNYVTGDSDKFIKCQLDTWSGLNPNLNSIGQLISWTYSSGYKIRLASFRKHWLGYWVSHRGNLRYAVSGVLNNIGTGGSPNVSDLWMCDNCSELERSRVNYTVILSPGFPVGAPPTPTFNWIAQNARIITETVASNICNNVSSTNPTICGFCN